MKKKKKKRVKIKQKKRERKEKYFDEFSPLEQKIILVMVIGIIIGLFILMATNTHVVGYDHFPYMPDEWVRSLRD